MKIRFTRRLQIPLRRLKAGFRNGSFLNRHKSRPWPETLEDRALLSPITVYPIPNATKTNTNSISRRSRLGRTAMFGSPTL